MPNTNIQIDTRDLRGIATAWQAPQLVQTAGHELRSFIWLAVILFLLFGTINYLFKKQREYVPVSPTNQQVSDYKYAMYSQCVGRLVAQGYNRYNNNNCYDIANIQTYNRFGRYAQ